MKESLDTRFGGWVGCQRLMTLQRADRSSRPLCLASA